MARNSSRRSRKSSYEEYEWRKQLERVLESDSKPEFVSMVKAEPDSDRVFQDTINYNAVRCATAMLEGETGHKLNLSKGVDYSGSITPLHDAASSLKFEIVELLLRYGARTDLRCYWNKLPLEKALEKLRIRASLPPIQSIFQLLVSLSKFETRKAMETVRLLAQNTKEVGVREAVYHYAKEGELVELAALLLASHEKVIPLMTVQSREDSVLERGMSLRQCILIEVGFLTFVDSRFMSKFEKRDWDWMGKYFWIENIQNKDNSKKMRLMSMLVLLEVFEKAGDALDTYLWSEPPYVLEEQVAEKVAGLLKKAGLKLKYEDVHMTEAYRILDDSVKLMWERFESLEKDLPIGEKQKSKGHKSLSSDICISHNSEVGSFYETKPKASTPDGQQKSMSAYLPHGSTVLSSLLAVRHFHTLRTLKSNFGFEFPTAKTTQVEKITKGIAQYTANLPSRKEWASLLALAMKRGLRRVSFA